MVRDRYELPLGAQFRSQRGEGLLRRVSRPVFEPADLGLWHAATPSELSLGQPPGVAKVQQLVRAPVLRPERFKAPLLLRSVSLLNVFDVVPELRAHRSTSVMGFEP